MLKNELESIVTIKEQLQNAMQRVEYVSRKSVHTTGEISSAIEGQVEEAENILLNMETVKNGMNSLSTVLNSTE